MEGVFVRQGHACCASSRVFVAQPVLEDLIGAVRQRMTALRSGHPLDEATDIGSVNSRAQLDKISELSESAEADGAARWSAPQWSPPRFGSGGRPGQDTGPGCGFWFPPTMFSGVTQEHRIAREELCWPVLTVSSFETPDEVAERTNSTR